jgi:UDP-2,4-diacetamido-2,4,6-trideoxy-beta-L-altropyranose hydrolase
MRCIALAQAWRRSGGSAVFASAEITNALEERLECEGFKSVRLGGRAGTNEDVARTAELAKRQNASWVVADGYAFRLSYQRRIKARGLRLLLLDDYGHAEGYVADVVLNQNAAVTAALYANRAPYTRLLLGTRYALLREDFLCWRNWKREIPEVAHKVLVTLGGSDSDNVTGNVIRELSALDNLDVVIIIGGSNPHFEALYAEGGKSKVKLKFVVDATNMPKLMSWADVAIAAGGSTSWELAFMGLPSLVLTIADNQMGISAALENEGVSIALGRSTEGALESLRRQLRTVLCGFERRSWMSRRGRCLVDGWGSARVVEVLREGAGSCLTASGLPAGHDASEMEISPPRPEA